jgi:hypothetical protein
MHAALLPDEHSLKAGRSNVVTLRHGSTTECLQGGPVRAAKQAPQTDPFGVVHAALRERLLGQRIGSPGLAWTLLEAQPDVPPVTPEFADDLAPHDPDPAFWWFLFLG